MRPVLLPLALVGLLAGCAGEERPDKLMETGWFRDTALVDAANCKYRLGAVTPGSGTDDWYHRDAPSFHVTKADPTAYSYSLTDVDGVPAPVQPQWSEEELTLSFELTQPLRPDTEYVITVTDCAEIHRSSFRTSRFGLPLTVEPDELIGRTYHLDMLGATWLEPGGAEALIQLYFSSPALLGVRHADEQRIDFIGAPGEVDPFGGMYQAPGSTWDFPTASFTEDPYFESDADLVVFQFQGVEIPIIDARLAATFNADGTRLGGGTLSGLGDTRGLGEFLPGGGSDSAICDLAQSLGIDCEPCPDGQPYCMTLSATNLEGTLVDGLTLTPRN